MKEEEEKQEKEEGGSRGGRRETGKETVSSDVIAIIESFVTCVRDKAESLVVNT